MFRCIGLMCLMLGIGPGLAAAQLAAPEPSSGTPIEEPGFGIPSYGFDQRTRAELIEVPPPSWTLADLEAMALAQNPTLVEAAAQTSASRGRQWQAGRYPNPVIGYHAMQIGQLGRDGQQGGFLQQRLVTGGKRALDQAIAGQVVRERQFRWQAQRQRILGDVRTRFYDALVAQQRVRLTTELARLGEEFVTATETLLTGRHSSQNDLLQAEIRADESRILRDNAANQQHEAWRRLMSVVGIPDQPPAALNGQVDADLPAWDWESACASVLGGHPELQAARARVSRARFVIERSQREPVPDVDVLVSHRYDNLTQDNVTNVQVGIPVPIFDRNQGNIRSARAELLAACKDVEHLELRLLDGLAQVYRRYANARHQVERYGERIAPRAEKSLQLVTDGYRQGQLEYLTLLTAQQTYWQVSLSQLSALQELRVAASLLESQLLSGSLTEEP